MDVHELLYLYTTDLQQSRPKLLEQEASIEARPSNSDHSISSFQPLVNLSPCHPLLVPFPQPIAQEQSGCQNKGVFTKISTRLWIALLFHDR
jgi:hypothetical protein